MTIEILTENHINELLELQRANLRTNIDQATQDSQGFVSFVYDPSIIKNMMLAEPQIIAKNGNELIGYALTTSVDVGKTIPLMVPLIEKSWTLSYKNIPLTEYPFYIMGQVCVKEGYRGQGVFDALYQGHKEYLSSKYNGVLTEISLQNKRSLAAHSRVGFEIIHTYFDEISDKEWAIVLWNWR